MAHKRKDSFVHGWVNFDKPLKMGSTQAVGKIRWLFQAKKAGHAGTLDPLASGILPIALGEATKTVPFLMDASKSYIFTITWGQNTDTWDKEGVITDQSDARPSLDDIKQALPHFVGDISQIPPKYSAIKIKGQRAYDLARRGEDVKLKARPVTIHSLDIEDLSQDHLTLKLDCGKGTYVRSLARDLAQHLSVCGHVSFLRRTRVGPFDETHAFSLDAVEKLCHRGRALDGLLPVETALDDIPVLAATDPQIVDLKHGRAVLCLPSMFPTSHIDMLDWVLVMGGDKPIALCRICEGELRPKRVFNM